MPQTSDATTSFLEAKSPASPDDSDANSNLDFPEDSYTNSNSDSHQDSDAQTDSDGSAVLDAPDFAFDLCLICKEEDMLGMVTRYHSKYIIEDAKKDFVHRVNEKYGIEPQAVEEAIMAVTPYPYFLHHNKNDQLIPSPILMGSYFDSKISSGLVMFQMSSTFSYPRPVEKSINEETTKEEENASTTMMRLVQKLQEEMKDMLSATKKLQEDVKRSKLAEEKLLAEITLMKADVVRETERATRVEQALERTTAAQADSIDDATAFIASGCREDTLAYYRIKVRHLINLAQAQLAYGTRLLTTPEECEAAKLWRQYCNNLIDVQMNRWVNTKLSQATKFIREKRNTKDITATNALINSGALELLVNDWDLRFEGDLAAHPGPLKKDGVEGYRLAIAAVGDEVRERHLTECISYLFTVEP